MSWRHTCRWFLKPVMLNGCELRFRSCARNSSFCASIKNLTTKITHSETTTQTSFVSFASYVVFVANSSRRRSSRIPLFHAPKCGKKLLHVFLFKPQTIEFGIQIRSEDHEKHRSP